VAGLVAYDARESSCRTGGACCVQTAEMEAGRDDALSQRSFLTEDEVRRALAEFTKRTGKFQCPVCNNPTWEIESQPGVENSQMIPLPGLIGYRPTTNAHISPTTPIFVITCDNCGYVRMHSIPRLLSNAAERKDGE